MGFFKASKWGIRLAGVWLVVTGAAQLFSLSFAGLPMLLGILALAAGVLILLDR